MQRVAIQASENSRPLYLRVANELAAEIERRALPTGTKLPSERELCDRFDVSRVTVRAALNALRNDGLVATAAGAGWFVTTRRIEEPENELVSFTSMAASKGLTASARVLTAQLRSATLDESDALQIAPGAELVELERLRLLDGIPVVIDWSGLPHSRFPGILAHDFASESLYDVMRSNGVLPTSASYVVEAGEADMRQAGLLELEPGRPVLLATQTAFDGAGRPIQLGRLAFRGDRYRFRARLVRRG
jgi:Transcriptional regulators